MPKMTDKQEEAISQIHHSSLQIAGQAYLCLQEARPGREWLLKMRHANERITQMLDRLEGHRG